MSVPLIKYPLDLTGQAATNLITGELHDLSGLTSKAFVLNYGPFYTNGLVVRNNATGQPLTVKTQYVATQLFVDMTLRTGLDICAIVVITDTTLPSDLVVSVDYQVLGGEYSASVDAIQQLINALQLGNQPIQFADIVGKPVLYPPTPHLHDLGDIYGFEYIVAALERVTQAIYIGDAAQFQAVYQYIDHEIALVQGQNNSTMAALTAHLADYTNPHRTTAAQVGLGNVSNFATAQNADGVAGTASNLFMTPAATTAAIAAQVGNALTAHINNHSNPHLVTAAQVGLGNVGNYGWASTADAQAGTSTTGYMNPALTAAAITQQALIPLNAHTSNLSNPHNTTAAQVGLGNVSNYATATNADAQAGTSNTLFMTPATTAAAITSQALGPLNAHINNHSNPHQVTSTQVGLGNVTNVKQVQAGGGTGMLNNNVLLGWNGSVILAQVDSTPMGQLFTTNQPDPNLTNHIANRSNPHGVTAAQVGLGNVNNTADLDKPVSNPQQAALNTKATLGSGPNFASLYIGGDNIYVYESSQGAFSIRTGSASQGYTYNTFAANGDLSIQGTLYAGRGFQPSDKRFKSGITSSEPRPLWRQVEYSVWNWNELSKQAGHSGRGVISQDVILYAPEYVAARDLVDQKGVLAVDYTGMAFETALAAGKAADVASNEVHALRLLVQQLQVKLMTLESKVV